MQPSLHEEIHDARILIVDDEDANVFSLGRQLRRFGYRECAFTTDPRRAADLFSTFRPDLVVLDLHMPGMNGFEVMAEILPLVPPGEYLPILMLTGDDDPEVQQRALAAGARDFLTKPFEPVAVMLRIGNLLETRIAHQKLREQNENLEERVVARTQALFAAQAEIVRRLALAAEYRDDVTGQHAERVGILSGLLAEAYGLDRELSSLIRRAAPLHDVGKIGIPDSILLKPGPLTEAEFEVMKSHVVIGGRILSGGAFPLLRVARQIALTHHECWNGSGYTPGLAGDAIPLAGRIVTVADVFDSLTHERPYKRASSVERGIDEVLAGAGTHFDPRVVAAFSELVADGSIYELDRLALEQAGIGGFGEGLTGDAPRPRVGAQGSSASGSLLAAIPESATA